MTARVAWCKANETHGFEHGIMNETFEPGNKVDHFTLLQVNTTAEPALVEQAYRFLEYRYGPSSPETANAAIYERLQEAYSVLADPVQRTAYESARSMS